jgi:hypothetical protein
VKFSIFMNPQIPGSGYSSEENAVAKRPIGRIFIPADAGRLPAQASDTGIRICPPAAPRDISRNFIISRLAEDPCSSGVERRSSSPDQFVEPARASERCGIHTLTLSDHIFYADFDSRSENLRGNMNI